MGQTRKAQTLTHQACVRPISVLIAPHLKAKSNQLCAPHRFAKYTPFHLFTFSFSELADSHGVKNPKCAAGGKYPFPYLPAADSDTNRTAKRSAPRSFQFRPSNRSKSGSPLIPKNTLGRPLSQNATKPRKSRSRFGFQGRHGDRELFWLQICRHLGSPHCRHLHKQRPLLCSFLIGWQNYKMPPSVGLNGNLPWSGGVLVICHPRPNLKII